MRSNDTIQTSNNKKRRTNVTGDETVQEMFLKEKSAVFKDRVTQVRGQCLDCQGAGG